MSNHEINPQHVFQSSSVCLSLEDCPLKIGVPFELIIRCLIVWEYTLMLALQQRIQLIEDIETGLTEKKVCALRTYALRFMYCC